MPPALTDTESSSEIIELVPYGEVTLPCILLVLMVCIIAVVLRGAKNECRQERIYDMEQQIALKSVSLPEGAGTPRGIVMVPVLLIPQGEDEARSESGCSL